MTKTIQLIQFHNWNDNSDDRSDRQVIGKWFILGEEESSYEFFDGEDDDGESIYVDKDCVKYFDNISDYLADDNAGYVINRRLRYSVIDIEVECDSYENIKWIA